MFQRIQVHQRVHERHPEVEEADVICACCNALAVMKRRPLPSDTYIGAGADSNGRMLEFVGKELDDGTFFVYHAMRLSRKMCDELGL